MTPLADTLSGLLHAVLRDPTDDVVRLVYADALEETGQTERAEFVRVQIELMSQFDEYERAPLADFLRLRERELLRDWNTTGQRNGVEWAGVEVVAATRYPVAGNLWEDCYRFRRGFVSHVALTLADFERHAKALFRATPITSVRLTYREPVEVRPHQRVEPWTFIVSDRPDRRNAIPWRVFDRMANREWYPTRDAANAALSRACVAYGRSLAGLPALELVP